MNIKKYIWMGLGFLSLGMAYIGVIVPGIPFFNLFSLFRLIVFAKSSKRMHDWLYNHKYFGPFFDQLGTEESISNQRQISNDCCHGIITCISLVHY